MSFYHRINFGIRYSGKTLRNRRSCLLTEGIRFTHFLGELNPWDRFAFLDLVDFCVSMSFQIVVQHLWKHW